MQQPTVGIDVGGTRTKGVLLSATGEVLAEDTRPTPQAGTADRLGPFVGEVVTGLLTASTDPVGRVGVAVPGLVDESRGLGIWSANLGWRDLDLVTTISPHVPAPVVIAHDVRAGLVAEHRLGAARGHDDACFVPIGTGLAAAVLSGGSVVRGGPWTGEIGHVTVDPDGPACGCGRRGCLEAFCGGAGLTRRWQEETGERLDARELARRAQNGDPLARQVWADGVDALATVLAPVLAAGGIEHVVIGGGLSRAGSLLLDPLDRGLRARLGDAPVQVVPAELGDRAGALGAAIIGRESPDDTGTLT